MASSNNAPSRSGIGFGGALLITFIVLKLTGVIAWSWLWVLAPLWGGIALALVILAVAAIVLIRGMPSRSPMTNIKRRK